MKATILMVIVVAVAGCTNRDVATSSKSTSCPQLEDSFESFIEKELLTEKCDAANLTPQLAPWLSSHTKIEGQWDSHGWHDGPHLTICKTGSNEYRVTHFARGDLYSFKLERTATFSAGVLTFNKPVKEYAPVPPYNRFYLLDTPRGPRFASQATVREDIIGKEEVDWEFLDDYYLLRKRIAEPQN